MRYRMIADELRRSVEAGEFGAGRLLPSESELSAVHGVSRVTVRKALELLRDEGLIDSRQGFGWFVAADPLRQALGRLGTIEEQLSELGVASERRVVGFRFVTAPPRARQVLGSTSVLEVRRVNLADGHPFARVTVWCPDELGASLSRAQVEKAPFYELLDVEIGRATQTIGAAAAAATDAELLHVPVGSPVLRCERVTRDVDDRPILLSEHVFAGHRTELVVELPRFEPSMGPSGLRLVE
ncbi:MAG TPA: GntR family transcriptional regulator [Acidimicrobiales bacterium]|jgi:GntR family transcriptional regulator|nr:GntR family transcriptional regulator [Acidimicrobiales bacterium]